MRCNICDKTLSDKEVVWNSDIESYDPCGVCIEVIMDAAYTSKFMPDDEEFILDDDSDELLYGDSTDVWSPSWENDYE